jgi:hypothetical protein
MFDGNVCESNVGRLCDFGQLIVINFGKICGIIKI